MKLKKTFTRKRKTFSPYTGGKGKLCTLVSRAGNNEYLLKF